METIRQSLQVDTYLFEKLARRINNKNNVHEEIKERIADGC